MEMETLQKMSSYWWWYLNYDGVTAAGDNGMDQIGTGLTVCGEGREGWDYGFCDSSWLLCF
jgi:hypothetical protein